jgi:hypothetical protein
MEKGERSRSSLDALGIGEKCIFSNSIWTALSGMCAPTTGFGFAQVSCKGFIAEAGECTGKRQGIKAINAKKGGGVEHERRSEKID